MTHAPQDVTQMLQSGADQEQLLPLVYDELKVLARQRMASERRDHTLQATSLVHEAYLKLAREEQVQWRAREHFYGAAAEAMRRILIDHARKVRAGKRGAGALRVTLGAQDAALELQVDEALAVHDAVDVLEREDAQAAAVIRLRFFSGLSMEECAKVLGLSERSVYREWSYGRARLFELLGEGE